MIRVVHPGSRIRRLTFYPSRIPDPGFKKASDPGSGSATLVTKMMRIRMDLWKSGIYTAMTSRSRCLTWLLARIELERMLAGSGKWKWWPDRAAQGGVVCDVTITCRYISVVTNIRYLHNIIVPNRYKLQLLLIIVTKRTITHVTIQLSNTFLLLVK